MFSWKNILITESICLLNDSHEQFSEISPRLKNKNRLFNSFTINSSLRQIEENAIRLVEHPLRAENCRARNTTN